MSVTLILGGARSGKSHRAQALAELSQKHVIYVATAPKIEGDTEWSERIIRHQNERPDQWETIEIPIALCDVLVGEEVKGSILIVDCLTLWLSNLMYENCDLEQEISLLCRALAQYSGEIILVSNEAGMGLVPDNPEGRVFRDAQGRLNQAVAAVADTVEFVAAGLPMRLKGDVG